MSKKLMNWMLLATVVVGLATSVTSCKDDDDDNNTENQEVGGATTMGDGLSDDDALLSALLSQWCEFSSADAVKGIAASSQTFEPTIGEVIDQSKPTERTIVMGTLEAADEYAVSTLSMLGINPQQPTGFSWKGSLGSVSYQHGTGNELGVINVSLRQIPQLSKLRLVKDNESNVKPTAPYYRKGDIVKYTKSGDLNGYYFICLNDHAVDQPGNWISFDIESTVDKLSIGNCNWSFTGKDYYYDKPQASMSLLQMWLENFVLNDEGYDETILKLNAGGASVAEKNYIVPINDEVRKLFIKNLIRKPENVVLDAWKPVSSTDATPQCIKAAWAKTNVKSKSSYDVDTYTPYGLLLSDVARWSMGTTFDYWVPNLSLVKSGDAAALSHRINDHPSQNVPSHFMAAAELNININSRLLDANDRGSYDLYLTAVHWTHDEYKKVGDNKKYYGLVDFTETDESHGRMRNDWTVRNITSHELKLNDNGKKYKYFEDVYCKDRSQPIKKEENGYFIPGSVIQDEQGTKWYCVSGWNVNSTIETVDRKARFIAFHNLTTKYEKVGDKSCEFADGDLLPERAVPYVTALLYRTYISVVDNDQMLKQMMIGYNNVEGPAATKLFTARDTVYVYPEDGVQSSAHIYATNVAYIPEGGRSAGTQPYMRVIFDDTKMGSARTTHSKQAYPTCQMYSYYNGTQTKLDAVHLFTISNYLEQNGPVKWDKWSHCKRQGTENRDGDFTAANRYNRSGFQASAFLDRIDDYQSVYHEPILVLRYMEFDDPGIQFMGAYNGHTFTEVFQPKDVIYKTFVESGAIYQTMGWLEGRVYKNGQPYAFKFMTVNGD